MLIHQASTYGDLANLNQLMRQGVVAVVSLDNKFFRTRLMKKGKVLLVSSLISKDSYELKLDQIGDDYKHYVRIRTQITRGGVVHQFEGYYIQHTYEASDLNAKLNTLL